MDLPRIFSIRESSHRIHNPLTAAKLAALGEALQLSAGTRLLDLASGSGEMLCTWARDHEITGTGVDISTVFTEQARTRAAELGSTSESSSSTATPPVMSLTSPWIWLRVSVPRGSATASPGRSSCSAAVSVREA